MVNINIEIPEEVHKKLKVESILEGATLKEQVVEILQNAINKKSR